MCDLYSKLCVSEDELIWKVIYQTQQCNIILTGVSAFVVCSVDVQVNIGLSQIPMSVSDGGDVLRYALMFYNNAWWRNV